MRFDWTARAAFAVAALVALPMQAFAQDNNSPTPNNKPESDSKLSDQDKNTEELVVTARKREESLQDVPLSVSAFSAEQLQSAGVINNYEVATLAVNFNTLQQVGRRLDRPTIRGQASPAVTGEANASYFIDGVFVSGSISTVTLGPIERVEILRGPQSAQFGRATFSGAINYVTKKPSNVLTGEIQARAGNNETRQVSAWTSGPIVDEKLAFFASAGWDRYGGEWRNSLKAGQAPERFIDPPQGGDSSRLGGTDTKDIVGKLLWTPNDDAEVTLKLGYTRGDDDHYVQLIQEPGELNCFLPTLDNIDEPWYGTSRGAFCGTLDIDAVHYAPNNPFNPGNPDFDSDTYPYLRDSTNLTNNLPVTGGPRQARYNLPDFYSGITEQDFSNFFPGTTPEDFIATPEKPGTRRDQKRAMLQYDQSFGEWQLMTRLAANEDDLEQAFDLDRTEQRFLNGVFTMFGTTEQKDKSVEIRLDSPAEGSLSGSAGVYYFDRDRTDRQKQFVGTAFGQLSAPTFRTTKNKAIFGALDYSVNDQWTLSVETRWANDEKTIIAPLSAGDDPLTPKLEGIRIQDKTDTTSFTPRFTVRYEPNDSTMLYALAAKGTKPAEFNDAYFRAATANADESLLAIEDGLTRIEEEEAWTYEAGTKKTWLDNQLTTNLSVYFIDWENQGVFQTVQLENSLVQITQNAGKSEVFGLELETSFMLTDNLTGTFGYGLVDGKFVEYDDPFIGDTTGRGNDENGNLINGSNNARGNTIPSSPKHNFVTSLNYTRQIGSAAEFFARTDFIYEGRRFTAADNFLKIPGRKLWNARIGVDRANWKLSGYVRNILDDQTPASVFSFQVLQGLDWCNGQVVPGNSGDACFDDIDNNGPGTDVQLYSATPTPGRAYGVEVVYRFGD